MHMLVCLDSSTLSLLFRRVWFSIPLSRYWTYPRVRVSESGTHDESWPPCLPAALALVACSMHCQVDTLPCRHVAVSRCHRIVCMPRHTRCLVDTSPGRYMALSSMLPCRPHAQAPTTSFLRLNLRISLTNSVPTDFFGLILGGSHQPPFFISAIPESMRSRSSP